MLRHASRNIARSLQKGPSQLRFQSQLLSPSLTEDEQALAENVREFAEAKIKPLVLKMDQEKTMDPSVINGCFEQGLMGIETPAELGGAGMSFTSSIVVIEELAKVDPAVSVMVDVQNTLVNNIFFRFANEAQRARYLPGLATDTVGCFCLSEAGSGTDAFALKTTAAKNGDKWVINGNKLWITNSKEAGYYLVMANVDTSKGYKGITCFVVDKSNPGLSVGKPEDKLGIRASSTCEVTLTDCEVDADCVVGEVGKGYKIAIETLNEGRIGIAAQMLGVAEGAYNAAMPYVFERKQFGTRIGDFQGMQHQYANVAMEIEAARLLTYNAARRKEAGLNFVKEASFAKLYASRVAEKSASLAIEWMGGVGFIKDYPVEKFFRDSKIGAIYEGTSNIQLQTIAKCVAAEMTQ